MKKLTGEEFRDRVKALARARKIFIPGVTKSISDAFVLYQGVLAEEERKEKLVSERTRDYGPLGDIQRPECPDCGGTMGLRLIRAPKGRQNKKGWNSCWTCDDDKCLHEEYSLNELKDWLLLLKKGEEKWRF